MITTKTRCLLGAILFLSLSLYLTAEAVPLCTIMKESLGAFTELLGFLHLFAALFFVFLVVILVDVSRRNPPQHLTILDALRMYGMYNIIEIVGAFGKWKLLRHKTGIKKSQNMLLKRILKRAKVTAYAKDNNFVYLTTVEEFRANHPLTDYYHYVPWIERVLRGENKVLIPEPVDFVCVTSGTSSGKSKNFPKNKAQADKLLIGCGAYLGTLLKNKENYHIRYFLDFRFRSKLGTIGCGIKKGPGSAVNNWQFKYIEHIPFVAKQISDFYSALYVNLVFALKEGNIGVLSFLLGSHVYAFFLCLEKNWANICSDIRFGRINESIVIEEEGVLDELNEALTPDPTRADELEAEFRRGFKDIIPRLWPSASVISAVFTGSFAVYRRIVQTQYAGNVPTRCMPHIASEGVYGINIWASLNRVEEFLFYHNANFFEFVPEENIGDYHPITVLLHELELNQRYEIVVTTSDGLYRYRTNDVITVTGFEGQIPTYTFAQRADDNINVFAEKTPMHIIAKVVEEYFANLSNFNLVDYAVTESANINVITDQYGTREMRYVLMAEMLGDDELTSLHVTELDERLQAAADRYRQFRHTDQIKEIQVVRLREGAFENLRQHLLASNRDASASQVKILRRPTKEEHLRQLLDV